MDKAVITCALTGVLTTPKQHPVPVTPAEMARAARDAGAGPAILRIAGSLADQRVGRGRGGRHGGSERARAQRSGVRSLRGGSGRDLRRVTGGQSIGYSEPCSQAGLYGLGEGGEAREGVSDKGVSSKVA